MENCKTPIEVCIIYDKVKLFNEFINVQKKKLKIYEFKGFRMTVWRKKYNI